VRATLFCVFEDNFIDRPIVQKFVPIE